MNFPTNWMANEMKTDAAAMGRSEWKLTDVTYTLEQGMLTITTEPDSLDSDILVAAVKPFFAGKHINGITNHHDGRYTVVL